MNREVSDLLALNLKIEQLIAELEQANKEGSPLRCRELSLAITNIEQGSHWLSSRLAEIS